MYLQILKAAALQKKHGINFVTLTVLPDKANPAVSTVEAFQVSDQAIEMLDRGIVAEEQKSRKRIVTTEDCVIDHKETRDLPVDLFVLPIAIRSHEGPFRTLFPVENRLLAGAPTDFDAALSAGAGSLVKTVSDFHLLLSLSDFLDINADMPDICRAVAEGSDDVINPERAGGYLQILAAMAGR
jgi:nuclear protein localization protein 4